MKFLICGFILTLLVALCKANSMHLFVVTFCVCRNYSKVSLMPMVHDRTISNPAGPYETNK